MALTHEDQRRRFADVRTPVGGAEARRNDPRKRETSFSTRSDLGYALNPTGSTFGALLRHERLQADMTMTELSKRIGKERSYISRIESAGRGYRRDTVDALADALRLDGVRRMRFLIAAGAWPWETIPHMNVIERIIDVMEHTE